MKYIKRPIGLLGTHIETFAENKVLSRVALDLDLIDDKCMHLFCCFVFSLIAFSIESMARPSLGSGLTPSLTEEIPPSNDSKWSNISFPSDSISYGRFRDDYKNLSDSLFDAKMKEALQDSSLMFLRSFVNTYYSDLAASNNSQNIIYCLGDAHLENFGFLLFGSRTRFVFNDLDDSGPCPLEFDILRYFAAVDLAMNDTQLVSDLIEEYVAVLNNKKNPADLPSSKFPDLPKKRKRI